MQTRSVDPTARGVLAATFTSAAVVAHLVAAKAARDALFLSRFDVALLPRMMVLGALVSFATALISARLMERKSPARLLLGALGASSALYAVESALLEAMPRPVAIMLYVHVSALGAMLVAALWSLINERFDPHVAKRQVGRIAFGGSFGGVLGGVGSWLVSVAQGLFLLLVMLALLNLLAIAGVLVLWGSGRSRVKAFPEPRREPIDRSPALGSLRKSPYLSTLAALVALCALSSALLEFVLSVRAVELYTDGPRLAAFFALFHASVGALAMLVQLTLTRGALERLGLGGTVSLLPAGVLFTGAIGLFAPGLWSAVLLRGSDALAQASFFRSAYELFYTPLSRSQKRPAKILIDVGLDRLGTIAGGGLAAVVAAGLGASGVPILVAVAMGASAVALFCAARLNSGYVEALAGRLKRGTLKLDERNVLDRTTRRTLAETAALDRRELLEAIERQRSEPPPSEEDGLNASDMDEHDRTALPGTGAAGFEAAPGYVGLELSSRESFDTQNTDSVAHSTLELRSGSTERVRAALTMPLTRELAPHVLPLLGRDDVARDALRALRGAGERIIGLLTDALLDPSISVVVRRRIPRVLERCPVPRAVQALVDGLFDAELEVREQCALALLRLQELAPSTPLPRERILDAIERELLHERQPPAQGTSSADAFDDEPGFGEKRLRSRAREGVEHVMTLLALALEREPVRLTYHALYADEPAIRGTALEYLDNVLPARIKPGVLAMVEDSTRPAPRAIRRDSRELMDELLRSRELVMPSALRAAVERDRAR